MGSADHHHNPPLVDPSYGTPDAVRRPPANGGMATVDATGVVPMSAEVEHGRLRPLLSGVVLRSQSDARLSALAADGHQPAFTTIFERYERELRVHAARIVRPARVDDVVQHTMLSAWSALLSGPPVDQLRPWLHRIVHNAALDTVARRGYDDGELIEAVVSPTLTENLVEGRLAAGAALAAIVALPDTQRRALTLTAIEGHSAGDAAAEMDVSESALRQLVYRARSRVRSGVSAVTPLPLLVYAGGSGSGAAATAAGAGAIGGYSGAAVKAAAVVAAAAGTLGASGALRHGHHQYPGSHRVGVAPTVANTSTSSTPLQAVLPGASALSADVEPADSQGQSGSQGATGQKRASGRREGAGMQKANDSPGSVSNQNSGGTQGGGAGRPEGASGAASQSGNSGTAGSVGPLGQSGEDAAPSTVRGQPKATEPSTASQQQSGLDSGASGSLSQP